MIRMTIALSPPIPQFVNGPIPGGSDVSGFLDDVWRLNWSSLVAVDPRVPPLSLRFEFAPPCPNPARGSVSFDIVIPRASQASLVVHDSAGRVINRIADDSSACRRPACSLPGSPSRFSEIGVSFPIACVCDQSRYASATSWYSRGAAAWDSCTAALGAVIPVTRERQEAIDDVERYDLRHAALRPPVVP